MIRALLLRWRTARRVHKIEGIVCRNMGLSRKELLLKTRRPKIAVARRMVYWLAGKFTGISDKDISRRYGQQRTSVDKGRRGIENIIATSDPHYSRIALECLRQTKKKLQS